MGGEDNHVPRLFCSVAPSVVTAVLATAIVVAAPRCPNCIPSRYWTVPLPTGFCQTVDVPCFPETDSALLTGRASLGVAFSGGGTRSATLSLGQLRGLRASGMLDRVRYISAISGGTWAAVPFTFSKATLDEFLGPSEDPSMLTRARVVGEANGQLANAIVNSSLASGSVREVLGDIGSAVGAQLGSQMIQSAISSINGFVRREPDRPNKTYTRLLGSIFIDPLVDPGTTASKRLFSWTPDTVRDIATLSRGQLGNDMVVAGPNRPFLIAGGTVIVARHDYDYPLLMPIEYTPLYVGVRQRFGMRYGGIYVSPWAYDSNAVGDVNRGEHLVDVQFDSSRSFTLADVIASAGAAPQLLLALAQFAPASLRSQVQQTAQFFPAFRHFTINDDRNVRTVLTEEIGHGDGGFSDNLGIMPLLARGVRNILVFDNTNTPSVENENDLRSLFFPIGAPDAGGDKRYNQVFESANYTTVVQALEARRDAHQAQVYCTDRPWRVLPNHHYDVAGYDGVNICWFYNSPDSKWTSELAPDLQTMVKGQDPSDAGKGFDQFPWVATFFQDKRHIIKLSAPQVNLLSNLAGWIVSNDDTQAMIRKSLSY